jgi:hypothetical protein
VSPDLLRAVTVVVEEAGEALKEVLNYTRYPDSLAGDIALANLITEVEQCGAACHRLLEERLYDLRDITNLTKRF